MKTRKQERRYVVCVGNEGYKRSLVVRRIYEIVSDQLAEKRGQCRVLDDSGEDYLYPKRLFDTVDLPSTLTRKFTITT